MSDTTILDLNATEPPAVTALLTILRTLPERDTEHGPVSASRELMVQCEACPRRPGITQAWMLTKEIEKSLPTVLPMVVASVVGALARVCPHVAGMTDALTQIALHGVDGRRWLPVMELR